MLSWLCVSVCFLDRGLANLLALLALDSTLCSRDSYILSCRYPIGGRCWGPKTTRRFLEKEILVVEFELLFCNHPFFFGAKNDSMIHCTYQAAKNDDAAVKLMRS